MLVGGPKKTKVVYCTCTKNNCQRKHADDDIPETTTKIEYIPPKVSLPNGYVDSKGFRTTVPSVIMNYGDAV
jgi:hypothetical protein